MSDLPEPQEKPYDSSGLRWLVKSQSQEGVTYLVQLNPMECQCRWWQTTVGPKLRKGEFRGQLCQHYLIAEERFKEWAKWAFREFEKNSEKKN
jgi:hypothetical protein